MNLSALSRADLVSELLSPLVCASGATPLHVSDAVAQMGMLGTADTVLAHRLNVARELLLRDLREQMRNGLLTLCRVVQDMADTADWDRVARYISAMGEFDYELGRVSALDVREQLTSSKSA